MSAEWDEGSETGRQIDAVPAGAPSAERAAALLVRHAPDDLAAERLDVAGALRLVASIAWRQGHDVAVAQESPVVVKLDGQPVPSGDGIESTYIVVAVDRATGEVDAEGPFTAVEAMTVAEGVRLELDASGMSEFTVALTRLRRPRWKSAL